MFEKPTPKKKYEATRSEYELFREQHEKAPPLARALAKAFGLIGLMPSEGYFKEKLDGLVLDAQKEAQKLNNNHERLKQKVEGARIALRNAQKELYNFEQDELGIKEEKAA